MNCLRITIDTKSLYFNIKNDNQTGHTATVATPLKQGMATRPELQMIKSIPEAINSKSRDAIIAQIMAKSRASARIDHVLVFNKVSINGNKLYNIPAFCMYIREETDNTNVHYGRLKLHYPISFVFEDDDLSVNNKIVLSKISEYLHNYAFIVEAFEYFPDEQRLNFDATIVGSNQVPYSKVFANRRGVGNKFSEILSEDTTFYDTEIIALREKLGYDNVFPNNYHKLVSQNNALAREIVVNYLVESGAENIRVLKNEYPFSIFDIEYTFHGLKRFALVQQTATIQKTFILPSDKIQFINDFSDNTFLFLVYDVLGNKKIASYSAKDINLLSKSIASVRFEDRK